MAKEWPDIDKLIELRAKKHAYDLMVTVFGEVNRVLTPVTQYVDHAQIDGHLQAIIDLQPDYPVLYQPFVTWAEAQTGLQGKLLKAVVAEGDAQEVSDAIDEFKKATSWQAPVAALTAAAPAAATPAAVPATRTLSDAAKKAAAVLSPVSGKRSIMPTGGDPNDFDGAWEESLKEA